ncbi:phosphatidylglycerol lysyltransferase domain-containing protein [Microbacterium sp. X-17]|uniref:bifunctional lysylphosphatidylglycerol flippase/synthetase MprF n=1 Tax=Microbacterium sp. X-17 TaxID=3144404 RepID=UPI0031F56946
MSMRYEPGARRFSPLAIARRIPATLIAIAVILVAGVISGALWRPFAHSPGWDVLAYGLPALEDGRWWTPVTGTLFASYPAVYVPQILAFVGMAYLEFRRGWRAATGYFVAGQLFAVLGTSLLLWALSMTPWAWAQVQAMRLDVGPSGGTLACIAAAIGLLSSPWRVRAWLVLLAYVFVTMLFWGGISDIAHLLAVLLVLFWDRSLRIQRTTISEQRFVAFIAIATLGAVEIMTLIAPTSGPFGSTEPASGPFLDIAIDLVVIALVAHGILRGRRWAWMVAVILAIFNVLALVFLIVAIAVTSWGTVRDGLSGDPSLALATSVLWLLISVYLIWVRRAFRAHRRSSVGPPPTPSTDDVARAIRDNGGGTLSWMTTWEGNSYARTSTGIVAYQRRMGVAIALADPIGPEGGRAQSVREFIHEAEHAGLVPCFFSASDETLAAVPDDWRNLIVADDTIVDLPDLAFTGKRWNSVRTSLNRAAREEMTFRMTRLKDEPWGVRQQLQAISEVWVGDRDLPEMGFTLGTLLEAADPEVRMAIAISPRGDVDGFLSWLPIYAPGGRIRGWTLDLMRRREEGFGPVMEFLIGSSAMQFSEEGAEIMSLSGAPLSHTYPPGAGVIADLSERLAESLEPVYGFRSLHRFKEKFQPRYQTMYLLYRDESDLTRIGAALTRAMLPTATLRQLAGAGLGLVRGGS